MFGTSTAQTLIDKGLRSSNAEQLAIVSNLRRFFEENPSPTFVNSVLLRVADAFKDGSLDIRVAIARSLGQCGSHLTLAFSSAEIFRRILTVSHSNDPNARETVLDVLAVLSPLLPESHQSHHLIRESLSTSHDGEFRATCHALKAFARISNSFAESIVLQIGKLLEEDEIPESRKVLLCSAFSTMSATAQVVEQVFGIADVVLRRNITDEYFHAFLNSTTSLCIEIRYPISKQIETLLALLSPSESDRRKPTQTRRLLILKELKRLAKFSNIWTEKQVKTFVSSLQPKMSDASLAEFFDATTSLATNCAHENLLVLKNLVLASTGYGSVANPEVSVRFVYFASKVVCAQRTFDDDSKEFVESAMTALTVVVVNTCTCGKLKKKLATRLFRAIGDLLLTFPFSDYSFSPMIISGVFSGLESPNPQENNQRERLELLCRLADTNKLYVLQIHRWACKAMKERIRLFENSCASQLAYLCLAVGTSLPPDCNPVFYSNQPIQLYETARCALRNGHWKHVAAPNLAAIDVTKMGSFDRNWIASLEKLAESQLLSLGLDELHEQQNALSSAIAIMSTGKSHRKMGNNLRFPLILMNAMLSTSTAIFHLVSVISPFTKYLEAGLKSGSPFFNPLVAKRFLMALTACESSVNEALSVWSAVCRASFCADPTSFDLITLYYLRVSVLLVAVRVVLRKQSPDTVIQIPPLSNDRTCSLLQRERLQWVIDKIRLLKYDTVPNINTINALYKIVEQLAVTPYMLPRFFFHQFYHVEVKISTTPQTEKDRPVDVFGGGTIPIRVDGSITSTHPSQIRSIIVFAEINSMTNHTSNQILKEVVDPDENNYFSAQFSLNFKSSNQILKEVVDPDENNYFSAQFLLNFKSSCEVKFRVEFIDQTSRKQWKADGGASLSFAVREIAHHHDPRKTTGGGIPQMPFMRGSIFHAEM